MQGDRRRRLLRALDIEAWTPRATLAAASEMAADVTSIPIAVAESEAPMARTKKQPKAEATSSVPIELESYTPPNDWEGLASAVSGCERCKLCRTRTQTVFGVGIRSAPLLVIGEGPGADEDAQGEPFVGRAGKLLDEMLRAIGRSRGTDTYIANVVKCRPPGNRDPEPDEVAACRPYLDRQIELIQPKLMLALGRIAAQRLLATDEPLSKLRGPLFHYGERQIPVLITYHPAYLLRSPGEKAKSWQDLKRVHRFLHDQN